MRPISITAPQPSGSTTVVEAAPSAVFQNGSSTRLSTLSRPSTAISSTHTRTRSCPSSRVNSTGRVKWLLSEPLSR